LGAFAEGAPFPFSGRTGNRKSSFSEIRPLACLEDFAVSSLRPLITITLLAGVGVFLYMKINETEPALPPGLEGDWNAGGFDVGVGGKADATTSATTWPPAYEAGGAPPVKPSAPSAAGASAPAGDAAPAWTPDPPAVDAPQISASLTPTDDSSPVARTATPAPDVLPEMPPLPGASPSDSNTKPDSGVKPSDALVAGAAAAGAIAAANAANNDDAAEFTVDAPPLAADAAPAAGQTAEAAAASATPAAPPSDALGAASTAPTDPTKDVAAAPPTAPPAAKSMYASVRVAVQGALDRGELAQALLLLSDWYGDPSLTPEETQEVDTLLGQLAGSVIYEGPPAHRLEQPYIVQAGETLDAIAEKYNVPAALLAKINGIAAPATLEAGRELKVVRGPFSAVVDLSDRRLTLMLDRRYAGQFALELDPATTIEEGQWKVDQKLLSPAGGGLYAEPAAASGEDRSLLLANLAAPTAPAVVVRGPGQNDPVAAAPAGRTVRLKGTDVNDVYDILSIGSRVTVRR
jgi:hypothetical protein